MLSRRAGYWTRGKRAVERAVQLPVRTLAAGHPAVHSLYEFAPQLGELLCNAGSQAGCLDGSHRSSLTDDYQFELRHEAQLRRRRRRRRSRRSSERRAEGTLGTSSPRACLGPEPHCLGSAERNPCSTSLGATPPTAPCLCRDALSRVPAHIMSQRWQVLSGTNAWARLLGILKYRTAQSCSVRCDGLVFQTA